MHKLFQDLFSLIKWHKFLYKYVQNIFKQEKVTVVLMPTIELTMKGFKRPTRMSNL